MKLYVIAGEDSGDLHTGNLIQALKVRQSEIQCRGVGGEHMKSAGTELVAHVKDINFMGFWEVIRNLRTIRQLFQTVQSDILSWQPDAVLLVDYPGFNLRMARFLFERGIRVFYYISPQVWAWKKGRVKKIRQYVERMFVILPFEQDFYAREGVEVDFVGHPLLDVIEEQTETRSNSKPIIALLPGSRKQEISRMLKPMLALVSRFPDYDFVVAGAPSQTEAFYRSLMGNHQAELRMNQTYDILQEASYAVVTSGTATLETALFRVPEVVCYRGAWISYQIGKRLVNVDYISLVNLILGRKAVEELIQGAFTPDRVERELRKLMKKDRRASLQEAYAELRTLLGDSGASGRTAELLLERIHAREGQTEK
ncbi:MAG: lipid-A-disaccharide synthase [Bacteroidota bacterium]